MATKKTDIIEQLRQAVDKAIKPPVTRYSLAKSAGISQIVLDRFMSGERDLKLSTVAKICTVLGLELIQRK